ncbi:MAG: Gar1/Naf1 family protein [Thaumarchaeota archaeon]|nr:Gar1/Naf1 family protein [Nitrososphaerota archaeon]
MQEIGEIMHLAGSGRVIIQLTERLDEGQILCDKKGTRIAKVVELIGPVKRPFASASPMTNNIKKYIGISVFAAEQPARTQKKYRRQKK